MERMAERSCHLFVEVLITLAVLFHTDGCADVHRNTMFLIH